MATVTANFDMAAINALLDRLKRAPVSESTKKAVANAMQDATIQSFVDQKSPNGVPWQPLQESTLSRRQRRGNFSTEILYDTGDMFASMKPRVLLGQPTVTVGEGLPDVRAPVSQKGSPTRKVPARPFFPENGQATPQWFATVSEPITDAWAALN